MTTIKTHQTILDRIVASKRQRLAVWRQTVSAAAMQRDVWYLNRMSAPQPASVFAQALRRAGGPALIGEIKRASPSRGIIQPDFDPAAQAGAYSSAGIDAISVLTEEDHFGGSADHLAAVRSAVSLPLLCKDFILEPAQIYAARLLGASAVLLICALHEDAYLKELLGICQSAGLAALVEIHDLPELMRALAAGATIIGINNRSLHTFQVELSTTERLAGLIPSDRIVVAESGIRTARDLARVYRAGAQAALIGEVLMRAASSADSVKRQVDALRAELPR